MSSLVQWRPDRDSQVSSPCCQRFVPINAITDAKESGCRHAPHCRTQGHRLPLIPPSQVVYRARASPVYRRQLTSRPRSGPPERRWRPGFFRAAGRRHRFDGHPALRATAPGHGAQTRRHQLCDYVQGPSENYGGSPF
jgi:hypothetical protein